jgi:hypothetical protein
LSGWVCSKLTTRKTGHFDFQDRPLVATPTVAAADATIAAAMATPTVRTAARINGCAKFRTIQGHQLRRLRDFETLGFRVAAP